MTGKDRRGIKSVEVAGRILDHLASAQSPVALRELAAAGRMSPGKVHRYLASFLTSGLARQDPDTRKYALGPLALRLGLAALSSYQPLRDSMALQHELRDRLDETMVLSVWGAQGPTIVHVAESSQPIIMTMRVGAVLPILKTATGLAFAAFLPRHFTEPLIRAAFKA
jgi:DNA-binding IclR family transcriptional regulator